MSDEEYGLIRIAMDRVRAEIALLKELEHTEDDNDVAYRERLACEDFLARHEPLFHWTRRLSPELLINIFICCTEGDTMIPWTISQVCRKWRFMALSTPQLWRKIPLKIRFRDVSTERRFLHFLRDDYIKRSGMESIIFVWNFGHVLSTQLYAVLVQHAERWGDVQIGIRHGLNDKQLKTLTEHLLSIEGRLQSLYSLKLVMAEGECGVPLMVFKSAPRLKYLLIDGTPAWTSDGPLQTDWPWNQLTHFSGTYNHMDLLDHHALANFTNLVYIKLNNCLNYFSSISDSTLTFPACKYLSLRLCRAPSPDPFITTNLIKAIHCPLLERFHITYYATAAYDDIFTQVAMLVQRHAPHLTSLHWQYDTPIPSHPLVVLSYDTKPSLFMMETLQQLRVLRITEPFCDALNSFLELLTVNLHLLPSLEKLDIRPDPTAKIDEVVDLCRTLNTFVRTHEALIYIPDFRQRIREVVLEVSQRQSPCETGHPFCLTRWEVVMQLEGWTQDLQDGWEKQVKLESELQRVKPWAEVLQTALDKPSEALGNGLEETLLAIEKHDVTEALVLHATGLHFIFQDILRKTYTESVPSQWDFLRIRDRGESLLEKWTPLFVEDGLTRRWTNTGVNGIIYISPESPLRGDPSIWMFGYPDDIKDPGYLSKDCIPDINPQWVTYDKLLRSEA